MMTMAPTMEPPKVYDDWTGNIVNGADVRSLDPGAVKAVRASFCERFPDRAEDAGGWDDQTFLSRAGVFKRGKVTVAAMILLGKQGDGLLPPSVGIRWRLYGTDGGLQDSRMLDGPAVLSMNRAVSMVCNWSVKTGRGTWSPRTAPRRSWKRSATPWPTRTTPWAGPWS